MTKRCKHEWTYKPDYPEDIICEKCGYIKKVSSLTRQQFIKLPMDIRRWILSNQAKELIKANPDIYSSTD